MTGPPLDEFDARPTQTLEEHLVGVVAGVDALTLSDTKTPEGDSWSEVMRTIAWTHDIGKLTSFFQAYLEADDRSVADPPQLTYHGEVSAFVTLQALDAREFSPEMIAAGFFAVAKHHSVLENLQSKIREYGQDSEKVRDRFQLAEEQLLDIDEHAATAANTILQRATDGALYWDDIWSEATQNYATMLEMLVGGVSDKEFYGCVLKAWSTLVAADKSDASGLTTAENLTEFTEPKRPSVEQLTDRIKQKSDTDLPSGDTVAVYLSDPYHDLPGGDATTVQRLAALRTAANARATSAIMSDEHADTQIFELTLPTGFGKTYTGLRAALTLADEQDSRVVYALPYTSVIDQVDNGVHEVFGLESGSIRYTKHHHLVDTRTSPNELRSERYSTGQDTLHAEAWRAGLVLTTFTQLFESIAGPKNIQSMKLPALRDSVIVIDEPQAVSLEWWALVGRMIRYVADQYNATVILMTATQPRILDQLSDVPTPTPLFDLQDECTNLLADSPRVTFELHDSLVDYLGDYQTPPLSLADAADELRTVSTDDTNTLAIVNTVGSAAELSEELASEGTVELGECLLQYRQKHENEAFDASEYLDTLAESADQPTRLTAVLTTRLRPTDRSALLAALEEILDPDKQTPFDDIPTVTVTTQLIEAGVDVSFDTLYRDLAPLPAIVQAAGRCNRTFGETTSTVTVWRLDSPADREYVPSKLIYGKKSLLRPTRTVLRSLWNEVGAPHLLEASVLTEGVEQYYAALHEQRKTGKSTDRLVEAFNNSRGELLRNSSLISQEYATQDVLVLATEKEYEQYAEYCRKRNAKHWNAARRSFQALKPYLISIPVAEGTETEEPVVLGPDVSKDYEITTGRGATLETFVSDTEV